MTIDDIPREFIESIAMPMPYQGVSVDATDSKLFKNAQKYVKTVPESASKMLLDEINGIFTTNSNERAVVTFSVRSMLDLYLQVRNFPPGSEIIMTGINIPDMLKIMNEHKIVVVPVDLDIATLAPKVEDV